jgi:transglutaminase-like putative cysteine protease
MNIRIGFDLTFEVAAPTAMMIMLETHPAETGRFLHPERLRVSPEVEIDHFVDTFGNRCGRLVAPVGLLRLWSDGVIWDSGDPDPVPTEAIQHPVNELPAECLQSLLPSRYCEVDLLNDDAWRLFGHTIPGWERVTAVLDWVHQNVEYGYAFARPTKTALEVYNERSGVCRDFQHLAITFCRALNIPARYASGYLGDIGIPPVPIAMDFHAWFEVFLGGRWYPVDARHNVPRIGRVLMARGRDAADTALTTSFGSTKLVDFKVHADEIPLLALVDDSYDYDDDELEVALRA